MPDWIAQTLSTTPAFLWTYLGVGIPWALALLPQTDRRKPGYVLATAFVLGPAWLTLWMFILGTLGAQTQTALLRADTVLVGTVAIAVVGIGIWVLGNRHHVSGIGRVHSSADTVHGAGNEEPQTPNPELTTRPRHSLAFDERLLIALIVIALVVRWFVIAYWPHIAYDVLWVYGYQGRLYTLLGYIPNSIDYYPQFLSLQYTFGQLVYGAVNDHAARAVVPFINFASTLAVYVLGDKLFGRRVGIYAAAVWTLYHHVGEWSRMGDLEIALTTTFTLAAAYFISALRKVQEANLPVQMTDHHALLAGLMLSVALWTKPTAGAFVWGVGLCLFWVLILHRSSFITSFLAYLRIALLTGLAAAPLGGMWYIRNLALGHNAVDFPPAFWLTQAMRSGVEFGWLLLAMSLLTAYLLFNRHERQLETSVQVRRRLSLLIIGVLLVLAATLPSIVEPRQMTLVEGSLLVVGMGVWLWGLRYQTTVIPHYASLFLLLLLALPYFVTWFWSYSYHYRLSFAIVPLLLMPTALVAAGWSAPWWAQAQAGWKQRLLRMCYSMSLLILALPGIVIPLYDGATGWDGLWSGELADDTAKQRSGNQALLNVVDGIQTYVDTHGQLPIVVAPGVQTLPFFFPVADIRIEHAPTRLDELAAAHYFIDSHPQGSSVYQNVAITDNQVLGALARQDIMRRAWGMDDGIFRYDVYELSLDRRWQRPQPNGAETADVVFGGLVRYLGEDLGTLDLWEGRPVYITLYWEVLAQTDIDYMLFLHLRAPDGAIIQTWDAPVALNDAVTPPRYYSTRVWQPGEFIADVRLVRLEVPDVPLATGYSVVVGLYDLVTGERVPVMVNGEPAGDGYIVDDRFNIIADPEAGS
ncbi:MAG: glycosyltransferase family 39 protein [Chloroflexota bacterium]|nr:glycosyltransferase family 39 protein [Chloroflexota bacterium]